MAMMSLTLLSFWLNHDEFDTFEFWADHILADRIFMSFGLNHDEFDTFEF
jgi:hypothetical protein